MKDSSTKPRGNIKSKAGQVTFTPVDPEDFLKQAYGSVATSLRNLCDVKFIDPTWTVEHTIGYLFHKAVSLNEPIEVAVEAEGNPSDPDERGRAGDKPDLIVVDEVQFEGSSASALEMLTKVMGPNAEVTRHTPGCTNTGCPGC